MQFRTCSSWHQGVVGRRSAMEYSRSVIVVAVMALWLQISATAPAQVVQASLVDAANLLRMRPNHQRSDGIPVGKTSTKKGSSAGQRSGRAGRGGSGAREDSQLEQIPQQMLKEMLQMDVLPEDASLDAEVQSNYMLELYNEVAENDTGKLRPRRKGQNPVLTENVRSFPVRGTGPFHGHWRLTFNSTSLPPDTELATYSTLAVYSRHCQPNWRQTEAGRMMKAAGVHKTNISVYATDHRHYADIRPFNVAWDRVKMKGKCWRTFDVTAAVRLWQQRRTRGMRHLILQQKGYDSLNVDAFLRLHSEDSPGNRPVLIVYSGKAIQLPSGSGRHRRDTQDAGDTSSGYNKSDPIKDNKHLDCARREFEIDFKKSGWDKWIISPLRYKAYRCAGACHFPIHPSIRSTLHARLEASVTHRNQQTGIVDHLEGSGPCCVPTLHSSITLLVHTSSGGSLRHIAQKMVAERCGCR